MARGRFPRGAQLRGAQIGLYRAGRGADAVFREPRRLCGRRHHGRYLGCFIGARSEVVEGCIIREGSVLGMGVYIGQSTKIVDRETGEVFYGEVPPYSVVVSGSMPSKNGINLYCAVIVKRVDEKTRSKTGINELLRD